MIPVSRCVVNRSADIHVVIIGRNEGERLIACLESLSEQRVIYVDSGSSDGSIAAARLRQAQAVELDMSQPFSAARARNAGFMLAKKLDPEIKYIQFVDGDCVLDANWPDTAQNFLDRNSQYAAIAGRLRERFPDRSIYNRLCDVEWKAKSGDVDTCGGIAMYRVEAFESVGKFNETVVAGEEPELCLRLRNAGWKIRQLDVEMALHDAAMTRFSQWWKRCIRGGYGGSDVANRFEHGHGTFSRQLSSARFWGLIFPLLGISSTAITALLWGSITAAFCFLAMLLIYLAQCARIAKKGFSKCRNVSTAAAYGVLTMINKWANLQGQFRYWMDKRKGLHLSLIEYKKPSDKDALPHV